MKVSALRLLFVLQALPVCAFASNSVVNLSHYDMMHPDFGQMKEQGIVGIIHEATYPRFDRDALYGARQQAATRVGLLWGAYHFGDATDPVRQADHFLRVVEAAWSRAGAEPRPNGILLVLDFEKMATTRGAPCAPIKPLLSSSESANELESIRAFMAARIGSEPF
jgi:hypothetical protein